MSYRVNRSGNAIPAQRVEYAGVHFRSIAEARWAVLFDALGVPWAYEPRRFRIGRTGYVPDFHLPSLGVWWEVKGAAPVDSAWHAAISVVGQTGQAVCMSWGELKVGGDIRCVLGHHDTPPVALAACTDCAQVAVRPLHLDPPSDGHDYSLEHPRVTAAFVTARKAGR